MTLFRNAFWPWTIGIVTVLSLIACFLFLYWASRGRRPSAEETLHNVWDEDLRENNNPLPGWWRWLFYGSIFFAAGYLVLFPGLAIFGGTRGWTQESRYEEEMARAEADYAPVYTRFEGRSVEDLATDPDARRIGERLYLNNCTPCHASDARGGIGYPSLRDADWQWGGTAEAIETTISGGRQGLMVGWESTIGAAGVDQLTQYVLQLAGRPARADMAEQGKLLFEQVCFSCHRLSGQGNPLIGGPNLTDDYWRWGSSEEAIRRSIADGRQGIMPAHGEILGERKVRLLAAYVYGLRDEGDD
ncbi:MAG: cytochrome-c oxidase, cbb3-type subunit III [Thermoanaerobaculia bacterium]